MFHCDTLFVSLLMQVFQFASSVMFSIVEGMLPRDEARLQTDKVKSLSGIIRGNRPYQTVITCFNRKIDDLCHHTTGVNGSYEYDSFIEWPSDTLGTIYL